MDGRFRILFVNPAVKTITGYSPEELIGKDFGKVFYPGALYDQVKKVMGEFNKKRDIFQYSSTIQVKDGSLRNMLWSTYSVRDKKGRLVELNGVGQLRESDQVIAESFADTRQKLAQVYDAYDKLYGSQAFWIDIVDNQGKVIFWNQGAEKISGYNREEVMGRSEVWEKLYPDPEYRRELFAKGKNFLKGEQVHNLETTVTTKDGKKKIISWHSNNLLDASGKYVGLIGIGIDVTERRRIEEQERLAQKMEGLARLAGGVAHDFNNMLSIIQGYLEMTLEAMDYADPLRENLLEIADAVERGAKLTNKLLAFSRRQVMEPISYDLNRSIKDMSRVFKRMLGDDIKLVLNLGENIPPIKADPVHIEQCLLNLVMNAKDAMGNFGTLAISTSLAQISHPGLLNPNLAKPGDYVLLSVADSGKGFPPTLKDRIFEPFFSTSEDKPGLGLATVYGTIKQHGGYIWVDSETGRGTTCHIYLPISQEPVEEPRQKELKTEMPLGVESILLVEDDVHLLTLSARILRRLGYTVFEANNPGEALLILEKYPENIHLMLTDIIMPKMNGIELSKKAIELRPSLKVLYVTGHPLTDLADQAPGQFAKNFLVKPFSSRTLAQTVREILDQK
jgi:PAS domain S-box-containing protein